MTHVGFKVFEGSYLLDIVGSLESAIDLAWGQASDVEPNEQLTFTVVEVLVDRNLNLQEQRVLELGFDGGEQIVVRLHPDALEALGT